jgi:hypothetical protein
MNKHLLLALLCVLLLSGCTTVGVTRMKANIAPKHQDCQLDIYSSQNEIEKPYEVVCLVQAQTGTSLFHDTTGPGAVRYARPYACQCGADAMLIMGMRIDGDGWFIPKTGQATIKAIRYK